MSGHVALLPLEVEVEPSAPKRGLSKLWLLIGISCAVIALVGAGTRAYYNKKSQNRIVKPQLELGQEMFCSSSLKMEDHIQVSNVTFEMLPLRYEEENGRTVFLGILKEIGQDVPFYFTQQWSGGLILPTTCVGSTTPTSTINAIRSVLKVLNDSVIGDRTRTKPVVGAVISEKSSLSDQDMLESYRMKATLGYETSSATNNTSFSLNIPKIEVSSRCSRTKEWKPTEREISDWRNLLNNCQALSTIVPNVEPIIPKPKEDENRVVRRQMNVQGESDYQEVRWPAKEMELIGFTFQVYGRLVHGEYLSVELGIIWNGSPQKVKGYELSYSKESTYEPFGYSFPVSTFIPVGPVFVKLSLSFGVSFGIIGDFRRTTATVLHGELGVKASATVVASASISVLLAEAGIKAGGQAVSGSLVVRFYKPQNIPVCLEIYKRHNSYALNIALYLSINYFIGSKTWEKILYEKSGTPSESRLYGGKCILPW